MRTIIIVIAVIVIVVIAKWIFLFLPDSWTGERMAKLKLGPPKEDTVDEEKYPMCAKLAGLSHERQVLVDFIEWLQQEKDSDTTVYDLHPDRDVFAFLEIDREQLEKERRAILDEHRKKTEAP